MAVDVGGLDAVAVEAMVLDVVAVLAVVLAAVAVGLVMLGAAVFWRGSTGCSTGCTSSWLGGVQQ